MKANLKKKSKGRVTLKMKEREAEKLMFLLMDNISWFSDKHGDVASGVYGALEDAGLKQVD